jgi:ATPase subunit of ABC transporter with duplicated ATPase domains
MSRLLIQFSHLFKSFNSVPLFEDISLSVNEGELFALIGENGGGKTTLLQLLAGILSPDSGEFSKASDLSIGFLPQEITLSDPSIRVRDYLEENATLSELERKMASCLENIDQLTEWAELHEKYELMGGYRRMPIEQAFQGLKLDGTLLNLSMNALSSGQRARTALAKTLIENPDLLLLDEPTNHLDREMLEWLQDALKKRKGASVIVSHDRKFLNTVCNQLVEIKNGKLSCYGGGYDFYLEEQERILEREMKAYEAQEEERFLLKQKIKAITFSKGKPPPPKDRNIMAYDKRGEKHQKSLQHRLDGLKARLEEIETNPLPHPKPKSIKGLKFTSVPLASSVAIEIDHASKAYGEKILFSGLCKSISKGDMIVITGANGCGKTTLLKAIAGLVSLDEGKIRVAPSVKIVFLDQDVELLSMDQTPLQYFESKFHLSEEDLRRELHKAALGGADLLRRPFSTLSTGQRKRMMLLALILEKSNVLLLDEPTNHLDFLTLEAFEKALLEFEGAVIAVLHDATFIEKFATQELRLGKE